MLALAPKLNATLNILRERGALIVHAPAGCMPFYQGHPARRRAENYRKGELRGSRWSQAFVCHGCLR